MTVWHSVILEERVVKPPEPSRHSFYDVSQADLSDYYRRVSTVDRQIQKALWNNIANWPAYGV